MTDARFEEAARLEDEGVALSASGDLAGAIDKFTRMKDLLAERASTMPDDHLAMRHVATATRRISYARSVTGDHKEALRLAREAMRICEAHCEADPANSEPERDLNLCCDLMGDVLRNMGRAKDAVPHLERGVELARWLASIPFGDEARKHDDLVGSLERLAWVLQEVGRLEDALVVQREQVSLARGLVQETTGSRRWRKLLASSLSSMGSVLRELGRVDDAQEILEEALSQYDQAFADTHQGTFDLHHRAVAHRRAGKVCAVQGDLGAAQTHLQTAVDLGREVVGAAPVARHCQWALQSALAELALVLQRGGDDVAARSAAREAAELEGRLRRQ